MLSSRSVFKNTKTLFFCKYCDLVAKIDLLVVFVTTLETVPYVQFSFIIWNHAPTKCFDLIKININWVFTVSPPKMLFNLDLRFVRITEVEGTKLRQGHLILMYFIYF